MHHAAPETGEKDPCIADGMRRRAMNK